MSLLLLPQPDIGFTKRKERILGQLAVPQEEYTDLSPKGSVDEGIRELIDEINRLDGFVTTSSCAGRVSVFLEGVKKKNGEGEDEGEDEGESRERGETTTTTTTRATIGGKGGGGMWLFVSHEGLEEGISENGFVEKFGFELARGDDGIDGKIHEGVEKRWIHFKFEPMILHILTSSPQHAQLVLKCGFQAGFRESGAHGLIPPPQSSSTTATATPMVGIRTMGLGFESLIGYRSLGKNQLIVSPDYLATLVGIANERFRENTKRITRFRDGLRDEMEKEKEMRWCGKGGKGGKKKKKGRKGDGEDGENRGGWEDGRMRRERKRAEGLGKAEEKRKIKLQEGQDLSEEEEQRGDVMVDC